MKRIKGLSRPKKFVAVGATLALTLGIAGAAFAYFTASAYEHQLLRDSRIGRLEHHRREHRRRPSVPRWHDRVGQLHRHQHERRQPAPEQLLSMPRRAGRSW